MQNPIQIPSVANSKQVTEKRAILQRRWPTQFAGNTAAQVELVLNAEAEQLQNARKAYENGCVSQGAGLTVAEAAPKLEAAANGVIENLAVALTDEEVLAHSTGRAIVKNSEQHYRANQPDGLGVLTISQLKARRAKKKLKAFKLLLEAKAMDIALERIEDGAWDKPLPESDDDDADMSDDSPSERLKRMMAMLGR